MNTQRASASSASDFARAWGEDFCATTMGAKVECKHRSYYLPSMTGIATATFECAAGPLPASVLARHRDAMGRQLQGVEKLHTRSRWSAAPRPTVSTASCTA